MFERGELPLVPFPFSDLSATKRRPVLALTSADAYGDFIALPVTSRPLNTSLVVKAIGRVRDDLLTQSVERFCGHIGFRK